MNTNPGAIPSGKLAMTPIKKDEIIEIMAVAIIISSLTWKTQLMYSALLSQTGSSAVGSQTQGPPLSLMILALTEMM